MTSPPLPVAFAFANLAMLGWLAAAAAPILIHLWMRQTHRETAWAAIRFLRAALERQARKLRLQHWILLATRTLLLVLLALAAAKPLLESGLLGGVPTHRVLVVDASLSMNAVDAEGTSALDRAKRLALKLVDNARAGDTHSLVVMGADAGAPLGRPTSDAAAAKRAIEAVTPSQGVADLAQALTTAQRLVDSAGEIGATQRQEVILLSDLAANTWAPLAAGEGSPAAELYAKLDAKLEGGATVSAFDVGGSSLPSVAVTSVALANGFPTLAAPIEVQAEARVYDGQEVERIAELLVDDAVVAERRVTLSADKPTPIDFVHKVEQPGARSIAVRLADAPGVEDRLADDNTRYVAVTLRPRVRVLCVAGAPGAADYLADALDPTGEGAFEPVVVTDADLPTIDLSEYVCIFLSNVRELSALEAERLRDYVQRGGGVAWFLGDRVSPTRYNETLAPPHETVTMQPLEGLRLVSADAEPTEELQEPVEDDGALVPGWLSPSVAAPSYRVDPREYKHPIVRPFQGQERAGLLNIPVMRHMPMEVPDASAASVALALENGDPLLVTGEVGRGRVAVLTTSATLDSVDPATGQPWTVLPAWPSFLPIVRGLVTYLANDAGARSLIVGEPIDGRVASDSAAQITVGGPDRAEVGRVAPDETGAWTFRSTKRAGVYRYGPTGEPPVAAVAVNVDPAESDPTTVATELLPESLTVRRAVGDASSESAAAAAPTPIHRWLLYGALLLALVEPAMACLFGRGSG